MGTAVSTTGQKQSFQQRITRIHAGGENTTRHVYVGPVDEEKPKRGKRRARREAAAAQRVGRRTLFRELLLLPLALALGALAVVAARAVGFHFLTDMQLYAQNIWYADLALAAVLALILRAVFKMSGGIRGKAFFAGFVVMVLFQALFVVRAPQVFEHVYSAGYVAEMMALVGPA